MSERDPTEMDSGRHPPPGVARVERCDLRVVPFRWAFAEDNAGAIDDLWARRSVERPQLFNGRIHLASATAIADGRFVATCFATEFKAYLFWREAGFPDTGVRDAFGSALLRSAEGHLLYGRQTAGNVNAGLVYPPGGFIDGRDVGADGSIDIAASIAREVAEETGLPADALPAPGGYWIATTGPHISMAREYRFDVAATELAAIIGAALAADPDPELSEIVVVRRAEDLAPSDPGYGRMLAAAALAPSRNDGGR